MHSIRFLIAAAVAALFVVPEAEAQIRIRLGNDLKPRIDFQPDRDPDDHNDDHHNGNQGGQHRDRQWHPHDDWHNNWHNGNVVRPSVNVLPQVVQPNSTFVLRGSNHAGHHGSYYCHRDKYYYVPRITPGHVAPQPVIVPFGACAHLDELASRIEYMANELCLDMHYNYQHNPGYRETYAEAYQLFQTAKTIRGFAYANDHLSVRTQLAGVDGLFHHIENDVRAWSRYHRRQIGQGGIATKLEVMESTLHHLMHDAGVHAGPVGEQAPPPEGYVEQAPPPAPTPTPAPAPVGPITPKAVR